MSVKEQNNDTENYVDTSMAPRKNRQNDRQTICLLYASSVVAASLSIAVASMQYADEIDQQTITAKWGRPLFSSSLYATCCLLLIIMAGYFEFHRRETFEAVYRGTGPVPFSVKFSVKGEKVNLYLRLGLAMFGLMSIGHVAVKCVEEAEISDAVFNLYLKSILEMAFYVFQTLFILRYHRLVILQYNELMGACLVHLLTTNLCIWADISVGKIDKTLWYGNQKKTSEYMYNYTHRNVNDIHHDHLISVNDSKMNHLIVLDNRTHFYNLVDISFYLLPTVSEYCLLAAALLYEIVMRIGQPTFIEIERPHDSRKDHKILRDCRGWNTSSGSWFGITTVLIIIALTTLTVSAPNHIDLKQNLWKCIVVLAEEAVLSLFGILFVLMAFYQTRRLKFSIATRQSRVDEFLLYTAFFFAANYTITTIILAADLEAKGGGSVFNTNGSEKHLLIGRCLVNAFEFIQMVLQTYFVQDSFYRCSDRIEQQVTKPGRQSVVALLGINLALWIQKSFQLKNADILFMLETNRGTYGWILFVVTMPISLFYRYHCTVCLSQCFNKLYEDETHRFEEMWRHQVDPFTDILVRSTESLCEYEQAEVPRKTTGEIQVIVENGDKQNRKLAVFSKTKPWRTFDLTDESQNDSKAVHLGHNHQDYNDLKVYEGGDDEDTTMSNLISGEENHFMPPKQQVPDLHSHAEIQNKDGLQHDNVPAQNDEDYQKPKQTDEVNLPDTFSVITQKTEGHVSKDQLTSARSSYTSLGNRRFSLVILPTCHYLSKNEELNSATIDSKTFDKNLQEHLSGTRQTPERRQVRRRRTLKNLETAKHRVLAAELAHRMVIERTSGASPMTYFTDPNTLNIDNINQCSLESKNSRSLLSTSNKPSDPIENSPKFASVHSSTREFRIAKAVTETAAITIAPVESKIAANIPLITFNQHPNPLSKQTETSHKGHLSVLQFHHRRSAANINRVIDESKTEDDFQKRLFKRCSFREGNWSSKIGFHKSSKHYFHKSSSHEPNHAQKYLKPEHTISNEKSNVSLTDVTTDQTDDKTTINLNLSPYLEVPSCNLNLTKGE
ncbi:hypothetical protein MN116_001930 [Schistosoma mekongi]|uniref:Otopetrin n=1 Tax=Schistosoma mekongi TaxID=38744 RepID=A0AAE1ZIZ4_SCHME|nr:hypothetical protein MN116_001930 [Schistosoma mekongi]